ncbi:RPM1-interacting protein 4-like isoform X1 [Nymphaea colorata]|nr:RPM1-interacting protein 4-like isoform X1 [Nymphaea colorata]
MECVVQDYGRVQYQFPAFGNWDLSDDMPITQYFESARQAGLHHPRGKFHPDDCLWEFDRHAPLPPPPPLAVYRIKGHGTVRRFQNGKETKKPGRVWDEAQAPRSPSPPAPAPPKRAPKAVDEDLYKIPPELLRKTRRRKFLNFFSRMFRRRRVCY